MKKKILLGVSMLMTTLLFSQANVDVIIKATWSKLLAKHNTKNSGTINTFDVDGKWAEWPILFQPEESEKAEEIDNMEFHMSLPEKPVRSLSDLMNYAPTTMTSYKTISFDLSQFEAKDFFKPALVSRFGSTKSIYCLSDEHLNPDEHVVVLFVIKNGVAKMIGFWIKYYRG